MEKRIQGAILICFSFSFGSQVRANSIVVSPPHKSTVNWAQPQVGCVEELVPGPPDRPCLDLSTVANPMRDWPNLPPGELDYWINTKRPINYCRAQEIFRRESVNPGSQTDLIEIAWMYERAAQDSDAKVRAIYHASRQHEIPAQVLTGALYQESLLSNLGIAEDGSNFSCGIGQSNLREWCRWANKQPPMDKAAMGWPNVDCNDLTPTLIRPFYEIAKTRLSGVPEYRMDQSYFVHITFDDVVQEFPIGDRTLQEARYQAAVSFIRHCSEPIKGIAAKANEISSLYIELVPAGLRDQESYTKGDRFRRACREKGYEEKYPLHSGWLMAVGIFNAGGRAVDALAHYNRIKSSDLNRAKTFDGFSPMSLVESFYGAGLYNPSDDQLHFNLLDGTPARWTWFKACVLQRHIARVVQHVTLANIPALVTSLEGKSGCARSVFDKDGKLIQSKVPPERQSATGIKWTLLPASGRLQNFEHTRKDD